MSSRAKPQRESITMMTNTLKMAAANRTFLALFMSLGLTVAHAQETRYVSDKIYVPVRSGAGADYRILHKGLPSGTAITFHQLSEDGVWAEVETRGGTRGWVRAQYLQSDTPATLLVADLEDRLRESEDDRARLMKSLDQSSNKASGSAAEASKLEQDLTAAQQELAEIRRISGAAIELDRQNTELTAELEQFRSEASLLRLENVRLNERVKNNQIIDGAIAVFLGVLLAIFGPRLIPRRRRDDGWA